MKLAQINERLVFQNVDRVPSQFKKVIDNIVKKVGAKIDDGEDTLAHNDIIISFGNSSLPTQPNTVNIGGKFENKTSQYNKFKENVPTIKTFTSVVDDIAGNYIAKQKAGQRQVGQMYNELPDNPEDYIFQPKVNIKEEFRVIVYNMNRRYYVSGIYRKTGSNMSLSSVSVKSSAGKKLAKMAIKATDLLGYGFSGVDLAIVSASDSQHVNESIGFIASATGKAMGSINNFNTLINNNYLVVLEANSFPSMTNPMIAHDLIASMESNAR